MKEQQAVAKQCKENPKKFWQYVKSKTKTSSGIGDIKVLNDNGSIKTLTDDEEKSNAFSDFFSTVFTSEPDSLFEPLNNISQIETNMEKLFITTQNVESKLRDLKVDKSPGPDNIHSRILKEIGKEISLPLKIIFDESLVSGKLPNDWTTSTISAIHKKGSKADVSNYRPICKHALYAKYRNR